MQKEILEELDKSIPKNTPLTKRKEIVKKCQDAGYWFQKGIATDRGFKTTRSAITCYKEALRYNINHFPTMYNLAFCFQNIGWLTAAKKWLKRTIEVRP